jgi:uncharacterized membrane protein
MVTRVGARTAPAVHVRSRWLNEPALVLLGYGLLGLLMLTHLTWPRALLATALAVFGTGYSFTTVLFPLPAQLDGVSRAALSAGLSVALGGILAFLLANSVWAMTLPAFFTGMVIFNLVCYVVVLYRRRGFAAAELPRWPAVLEMGLTWWGQQPTYGRVTTIALLLAVAAGGGALYQAAQAPATAGDPPLTEFFLLDANRQIEQLPTTATAGQPLPLTFGIISHERTVAEYQVRVVIANQVISGSWPAPVAPGEEYDVQLDMQTPATLQGATEVRFLLYRDGQPYRELHLWLDIKPGTQPRG